MTRPLLYSLPAFERTRPDSARGRAGGHDLAADRFVRLFQARGAPLRRLPAPEQIKGPLAAAMEGIQGSPAHIMFRDIQDIRPLHGAYNVAYCTWALPVLQRQTPHATPILLDQDAMLSLAQEIWTPTAYGREVLLAHGAGDVHVIPAPLTGPPVGHPADKATLWRAIADVASIPLVSHSDPSSAGTPEERAADETQFAALYGRPLGKQPALTRAWARGGPVMLAVCTAVEPRKNLANLLEGFLIAAGDDPDAVLLVQLDLPPPPGESVDPLHTVLHALRGLFGRPHALLEDRVVLFGERLAPERMAALYGACDFFLSASMAEGQTFRLQDAVMHGCLPVAPSHTALAEIIDETTAVVMSDRPDLSPPLDIAEGFAPQRYSLRVSDRYQVADAVQRALRLEPDVRTRRLQAARTRLASLYAPDVVWPKIAARLAAWGEP